MNTNPKTVIITSIAVLAIALTGCQTVQGVGKDIQTVGKKAEEVVKK